MDILSFFTYKKEEFGLRQILFHHSSAHPDFKKLKLLRGIPKIALSKKAIFHMTLGIYKKMKMRFPFFTLLG